MLQEQFRTVKADACGDDALEQVWGSACQMQWVGAAAARASAASAVTSTCAPCLPPSKRSQADPVHCLRPWNLLATKQ